MSGRDQRFGLTFEYVNPERGHVNFGFQVVYAPSMEAAAARLARERSVPEIRVLKRHHANGSVVDVDRVLPA